MDENRQPAIDVSTWEVLLEVYQILAGGDGGKSPLNATDVSYLTAALKSVLMLNSLPSTDPRSDPKILDRIKTLGRNLLP